MFKESTMKQNAYDIISKGNVIDTVFFDAYKDGSPMSTDEVRKSLIEHDGYPDNIKVKKNKTIVNV